MGDSPNGTFLKNILVFYIFAVPNPELVLWIRIRTVPMFLGLPAPDPFVRGTDPDSVVEP
jgi:hypothetical protein